MPCTIMVVRIIHKKPAAACDVAKRPASSSQAVLASARMRRASAAQVAEVVRGVIEQMDDYMAEVCVITEKGMMEVDMSSVSLKIPKRHQCKRHVDKKALWKFNLVPVPSTSSDLDWQCKRVTFQKWLSSQEWSDLCVSNGLE